ncbi:MAG TPA: acyl-CoA dehydrogenase family protein [Acidimicrobiia bacterium]|nr:acyl-CoA dehydrogenase family protein [Acidimicrobiia bacterium]
MTAAVHDHRSDLPPHRSGEATSAFRGELRAWLEEHPPPDLDAVATPEDAQTLRSWQRTLHDGRWVGVNWPVDYGGRGATLTELAIYNEELARASAPPLLGRVGVTLVGPTLLAHGTVAQRERWMPRILAGDDVWCQLFSEPDAGSDLASLSTRADRRGDAYLVSGQKVWSSHARWANWGLALVRTDPTAARHRGISMLAIPMTARGVDVRPLRQITGDREFNEVFLDQVEVPAANLIGPEHEGWAVANTTLANERGASFIWKEQVLYENAIRHLWRTCRQRGRLGDPVVRQTLAQAWMEVEIFRLHNARTLARLDRGESIGPEASLVKLWWSGMSQRFALAAAHVLGPDTLLLPEDRLALDGGRWAQSLLSTRANSIMGGTSEIQRTILGERVLGLPREPSR